MTKERIESFEEFWTYYVSQHSKKSTRTVHFVATTAALGCVAWGLVLRKKWLLALAPVVGVAPAWLSHLFVERNMPVSFRHPLWALYADLVMWSRTVQGTMDAEAEHVMERLRREPAAGSEDPRPESAPDPRRPPRWVS